MTLDQKVLDFQDEPGSISVRPWPIANVPFVVRLEVKDGDYDVESGGVEGHACLKLTKEEARQLVINIMRVLRGDTDDSA